jgi:hypothetical protein
LVTFFESLYLRDVAGVTSTAWGYPLRRHAALEAHEPVKEGQVTHTQPACVSLTSVRKWQSHRLYIKVDIVYQLVMLIVACVISRLSDFISMFFKQN